MPKKHVGTAVELILAAMSLSDDGDYRTSALLTTIATQSFPRTIRDVFFHHTKFIKATLFVRSCGPTYLSVLSMEELSSLLLNFIASNVGALFENLCSTKSAISFCDAVPGHTKLRLVDALSSSQIFEPRNQLTIYPLVPISVDHDFVGSNFFIVRPESLESNLPANAAPIRPTCFPPSLEWNGRTDRPKSWLGVRSPLLQASDKSLRAVLGALALSPLPQYRYQFSLRSTFGGRCTFSNGIEFSFNDPATPPLRTTSL